MTDPTPLGGREVMTPEETPKQEVRRLGYIVKHLRRLSPAGLRWVRSVCDEMLAGR